MPYALCPKPYALRPLLHPQVEVGANSCIDRGSWRDTIVGDGTKIDNLVQVGPLNPKS